MLSFDANLLLYAAHPGCPENRAAVEFLNSQTGRDDIAISEFILVELYILVRNPAVFERPLDGVEAAALVESYRHHPRWMIVGYPSESRTVHDRMWQIVSSKKFPRRRIIDIRTAFSLQENGVKDFATANIKDFQELGFRRVWNPLERNGLQRG
ncbi:MAG: VapC toxin family PIN domain ribonuclease [Planctomycetota bacterium]